MSVHHAVHQASLVMTGLLSMLTTVVGSRRRNSHLSLVVTNRSGHAGGLINPDGLTSLLGWTLAIGEE